VKKSWLAYDIGLAVASGRYCLGERKCVEGDVLYLALEDGERRLQSRATKLLPTFTGKWPDRFHYQTKWPRANQGGIDAIDKWCEAHPEARLVVIDVLAKFRAPTTGKNVYAEDYSAVSALQELASRRLITILVIHHTRKGVSDDPVEEISGTLGLGGGADAFLILKWSKSEVATLIGRGRDTEDIDLALEFNKETCRWTILGEAAEVQRSKQRGRILVALEDAGAAGLSPKEVAGAVEELTHDNAKQTLRRMAMSGEIKSDGKGRYFHNSSAKPGETVSPVSPAPASAVKHNEIKVVSGDTGTVTAVTPMTSVTPDASSHSAAESGDTRMSPMSPTPVTAPVTVEKGNEIKAIGNDGDRVTPVTGPPQNVVGKRSTKRHRKGAEGGPSASPPVSPPTPATHWRREI
jgi:hypothetical protein